MTQLQQKLQIAKNARILEILETCKNLKTRARLITDELLFGISWKEYTIFEIFADFYEKISKEFPDYLLTATDYQRFNNVGDGFVFIFDLIERVESYSTNLHIFVGHHHRPDGFVEDKIFTLPIDEVVESVYKFMMTEKLIAFKISKN